MGVTFWFVVVIWLWGARERAAVSVGAGSRTKLSQLSRKGTKAAPLQRGRRQTKTRRQPVVLRPGCLLVLPASCPCRLPLPRRGKIFPTLRDTTVTALKESSGRKIGRRGTIT